MNRKITTLILAVLAALSAAGFIAYKNGWFKDDGGGHTVLEHAVEEWTCSMHPFIIKDKPGTCPICGMALIKKLPAGGSADKKTADAALKDVSLSPVQRVMANVETAAASVEPFERVITAVGTVQYDQSRQAKVTAWISGRIEKLYAGSVGKNFTSDAPVAEIYSPELVATQQEYLLALKSRDQLRNSPIQPLSGNNLVESARQRLLLFGVKESQIAELEKAGKPNIRLPVYTPISGVVIEKMVQQGQYVNVGDVLFNVADLSRVWVEMDIYENDLPLIKTGQRVAITSPAAPSRKFFGSISYIYPFLDPKSRTAKARIEIDNRSLSLKPEMFVTGEISVRLGAGVVIPVSAVIDSGRNQTVWIETREGVFEPRTVQTGERNGDRIQIVSGVRKGEKVAVSGAYLIDSESQLRGGGVDHSSHTGKDKAGGGGAPAQNPAKKTLNMDDMKM